MDLPLEADDNSYHGHHDHHRRDTNSNEDPLEVVCYEKQISNRYK